MSQYASKAKTLESEAEPEPKPAPAAGGASATRGLEAPPAGAVILGASTDWKEDEEQEVEGIQRKVKRYRMIKELYAATEKVVPASSGSRKKK